MEKEPKPISQVIQESQLPTYTLAEALKTYEHIELTEDEMNEAILWRKQKKDQEINLKKRKEREEENRKKLTSNKWSSSQTDSFMMYRANNLFGGKFKLDKENQIIYEMLCMYFSNDQKFIEVASGIEIPNPSLDKGIMLLGNFGVGKTWLMKLFARNNRQVFHVKNAKDIADSFERDGDVAITEYVNKPKNAINDADSFFQTYAGLCIDDLGTEDVKVYYGNRKNVLGDILEKRYAAGNVGIFLHTTTNLNADQLVEFYGKRVTSRMREIFNLIEMNGNDRRK